VSDAIIFGISRFWKLNIVYKQWYGIYFWNLFYYLTYLDCKSLLSLLLLYFIRFYQQGFRVLALCVSNTMVAIFVVALALQP
jgi:hypothetical protein